MTTTEKCQYVLGIELGGGHATCGIAHPGGILVSQTITVPPGSLLEPLLPCFAQMLQAMLVEQGIDTSECAGLGLAFCGLVDTKRNKAWCIGSKYDDAVSLNLEPWCEKTFGLPFQMENDARLALLGESIAGAAKGCNDVVMILLGTGFGTAAIMEGRIVQGRYSLAAARGGHYTISLAETPCFCGNVGCVETEASTWSLSEISKRKEFSLLSLHPGSVYSDFRSLVESCETKDPGALALLAPVRVWSAATITMVHAYDADTVILGGGVMRASELILPRLAAMIQKHAWTPWGTLDVRKAALGESASLIGITRLFNLA